MQLSILLLLQVANMDMVEVDLTVNNDVSPPPSLGIRVVGVNMIHGVQDKLNIYVKKVVDDSLAGKDGRILVNDHIIEVNGISLVGVSQKLAAQTLSNCAISPDTGTVHFVLARPRDTGAGAEADTSKQENKCDESKAVLENEENVISTKNVDEQVIGSDKKIFTNPGNAFLENVGDSFVGRDAVRLKSSSPLPVVPLQSGHQDMAEMSTFSKQLVLFGSLLLVSVYVTAFKLK